MIAGLFALAVLLALAWGLGFVAYRAFKAGEQQPQQRVSARKVAAAAEDEEDEEDEVSWRGDLSC